jgi:hypothetical protein
MRLLSSRQNTDYHLTVDHASFRFQPFQEPRPCIYCGLIFHVPTPVAQKESTPLGPPTTATSFLLRPRRGAPPTQVGESSVRDNPGNLLYIKVKNSLNTATEIGVYIRDRASCARGLFVCFFILRTAALRPWHIYNGTPPPGRGQLVRPPRSPPLEQKQKQKQKQKEKKRKKQLLPGPRLHALALGPPLIHPRPRPASTFQPSLAYTTSLVPRLSPPGQTPLRPPPLHHPPLEHHPPHPLFADPLAHAHQLSSSPGTPK